MMNIFCVVMLLSVWFVPVNGNASNDLAGEVKKLKFVMSSMKRTLSKLHEYIEKQSISIRNLLTNEARIKDIIEKQKVTIEQQSSDFGNLFTKEAQLKTTVAKQNDIIQKISTEIKITKKSEQTLKLKIENLNKDLDKMSADSKKSEQTLKLQIENLNKDLDKMSADSKKSEQTLKLEIGNVHKDLQKMKKTIGSCCTATGKSKECPAQSCKWLRENSRNVESGLFWVSLNDPTKVYCDMNKEYDGGGWTMIGQAEARTDPEGEQIYYRKIISNNIAALSNVMTKRYLLSGTGLRELQKYINFTQVRFYCHKPWHGRTLHIYTMKNDLGKGVVDLITGKSDKAIKSCNSYVRMSDDDSIIASHCESWDHGHRWDGYGDSNVRMYSRIIHIDYHNELVLRDGSVECDDYSGQSGFNKIGRWAFYVR